MSTVVYFAYGSNMSSARIRHRVQSASAVSTAHLPEHRLRFHKRSLDGSAKCDIEHTGQPADRVFGVIYTIHQSEKVLLDDHEGLGNGYEEKHVSIHMPDGDVMIALTYYATHIDTSLQPYHWYKEHVLRGAREHALPGEHIAMIEAIESIADPSPSNHAAELSIYPDVVNTAQERLQRRRDALQKR